MVENIKVRSLGILRSISRILSGAFILILINLNVTWADVTASVDRNNIELNESFTLKIIVDSLIDEEPDASALEKDFIISSRSQLSNTTIINGAISKSRTWSYTLTAKRAGDFIIPSVIVGSEKSQPLDISILPQTESILGKADIFISAEVDSDEGYVQAQNIFRIKIYRNVQTRQPRLYEPEITGAETIIETVGDDRNYESVIDGKTYNVIERVYALFPQESGLIEISPVRFEARILKNGSITGKKIYQSDGINIDVLPIPSPPSGYPSADWLPAKELEIIEEWSRDLSNLKSGEPITRQLTITAKGQLSTQLPLINYDNEGLKIYPDKPKLVDFVSADDLVASRIDQYAIISSKSGEIDMEKIEIPWWDINENKWKIASVPERTINISPSSDDLVEDNLQTNSSKPEAESLPNNNDFWRYISGFLGILWVFTILIWFFSKPKLKREKIKSDKPVYKKSNHLLKKARKAALNGENIEFNKLILEWGKMQWPEMVPLSLLKISNLVEEPFAEELKKFDRATYGPDKNFKWDGKKMAKSLNKISVIKKDKSEKNKHSLPPLLPN